MQNYRSRKLPLTQRRLPAFRCLLIFVRLFGIGLFHKRASEDIIRGRFVKIRKTHKVLYGYILKPPLITGINGLFDAQQLAYLLLGHVHVLTKIS